MKFTVGAMVLALLASILAAPGYAQSRADVPDGALQVTPYLWAAGLSGDISPFRRAPTVAVDKSFSEIFEDLNFGGFLNVWARSGSFVFSFDTMYVDTSEDRVIGPLPPLPVPIPPGTVINANLDTQEFHASIQGGLRVLNQSAFTLDVLAGARIWHISNELKISALGVSRSVGESFGWMDPLLGARAFYRLSDTLSVQAQADVGGFGVGSDITWSVLATGNYILTENLSVSAGYKILEVDYSDDGYVFDTRLSGPVLGATWRF